MVNLAAPEQAERMGDPSLEAAISCMQVRQHVALPDAGVAPCVHAPPKNAATHLILLGHAHHNALTKSFLLRPYDGPSAPHPPMHAHRNAPTKSFMLKVLGVDSDVQALQAGAPQVPYADSCLTRYLMDSMGGGRSRAVLIATCRRASHAQQCLQTQAPVLLNKDAPSCPALVMHPCCVALTKERSWQCA